MIRAGWNVRYYVNLRDRGICAICGADGNLAKDVYRHLASGIRGPSAIDGSGQAAALLLGRWRIVSSINSTAWWEADHIVPVSEGGGGCGLGGYRTLCRPDHLDVTLKARLRKSESRGRISK